MQVVAMRNLAIGQKSYVIGQALEGVDEKRIEALIRDGFAAYVQPKADFIEVSAVDEEVEALDPEKNAKRVKK